jgi:multiple sugar transport system ATP-binding protein
MADLKITGLQKYYGAVHAVQGIDLEIPKGEFTVLVGPSGCGKSTLLRTIAGLEDADGGTIEIAGKIVNDMRPRDRDVAMVFQSYALYPYMSVFENIAFGLRARKTPAGEIGTRVKRAAQMLGIEALLERYPRQLSGGQRQRVAIGRAIVRNARLFLFDEPLSNLDAQLRDEMRGEIKRLHNEIGATMIYVTHDQVEAMTLADRIVLLNNGRIEQAGPPLALFERPATQFVAGFLGSPRMNFVPGTLEKNLRFTFADGSGLDLPSDRWPREALGSGKRYLLGVRPEHISSPKGPERKDHPRVTLGVDLIQPTGTRTYVTCRLGGHPVIAELQSHDIDSGDETIDLAIDLSRANLIDTESGKVVPPAGK